MNKKDLTLRDWSRKWLELYVKPVAKPSGYEHYRDNLEKHILPCLGPYSLPQLTPPVVQTFLNRMAESGNLRTGGPLSSKSVKNIRVVLDVCCKRAVADGHMKENPVPATVCRRCASRTVEILSDQQQKVLERWLFQNLTLYSAGILLALYSGMRLGECCALRWKCYDPTRGELHIRETVRRVSEDPVPRSGKKTRLVYSEPKTAASRRTLALPDILLDLLDYQYRRFLDTFGRAPAGEDFILYNAKGGAMDPDNLSHYFGDVLEGLGLPHVKYHAMRHTFATRAIENGVDVATVSGLLGHADVTTTTHYYVHPRQEAMRRAMRSVTPVTRLSLPEGERVPQAGTAPDHTPATAPRVCRRKKWKAPDAVPAEQDPDITQQ